eukprot:12406782-Prorocentrum_lima.AAC.1
MATREPITPTVPPAKAQATSPAVFTTRPSRVMVGGRRSALLQASAEPRRELQSSSPAKMRRRN